MNKNEIDIEILTIHYLEGTCTPKEREYFLGWLHTCKENEKQFYEIKELYDSRLRFPDQSKTNQEMWERLYNRITYLDAPVIREKTPLLKKIPEWIKYIAIIVVMAGLSYLYTNYHQPEQQELVVRQMEIHNTKGVYQLILPDSTKVWLHGGTTITYPKQFGSSSREITLDGEAYFQVESDKDNPFIIHTNLGQIKATGTEFNVTAYSIDDVAITTLVHGTVNILAKNETTPVVMDPGQQSIIYRDSIVQVQRIDPKLFTDWKDGIYRFKNEPLEHIALQLEKMFGIKISIPSERLKKARFNGMFTEDHSLKEVFEIINISSPLTYKINGKNVTLIDKSYKSPKK